MNTSTWERYGAYLETPPLQVLEWNDAESDARGWLVVNSLRGGAAGGGTRMHRNVTREEVTYLAKAMQLKFAYSGPPIGGAKSGIRFDAAGPGAREVLARWYRAIRPFLTTCYGTGGDVNVDEQRDVVPLCAEMGILHPQEGIARGHFGAEGGDLDRIIGSLGAGIDQGAPAEMGVEGVAFDVSDLVTGYGVARAAERLYAHRGESLERARVIVEGFGNVGAAACLYLARAGARIVGIADAEGGVTSPEGLDAGAVEDLIRRRKGRTLPDHPLVDEEREYAYRAPADLFVPAAISGSLDTRRLAQMARHGVRRIVCGANQPFHEARLGGTDTARAADHEFDVVPEIVASLGMARTFYHLMANTGGESAERIFEAVRLAVDEGVEAAMERAGKRGGVMGAAIDIAMERMEE